MDHTREHRSLLASAEQQLLVTIARRLPPWLTSDHLTLLGLLAMPAAGLAFAAIRITPWNAALVAAALAVNWFGDSLDGTLARVRRQERPRYGFYVDHVLDVVGATMLMGGMALSGFMTPLVALGVLVAYLLVSAEVFLATAVGGEFRLSFVRVGPTELRILLAAGACALIEWPTVPLPGVGAVLLLDVAGVVAIAGLLTALTVSATLMGRQLYVAEPRQR